MHTEANWQQRFNELAAFHREHGHFNVLCCGKYGSLGRWVKAQRTDKSAGQLPPEHELRLAQLGFIWERHSLQNEQAWERHFNALMAFHQEHGHFNIPPQGDTTGLCHWANQQRSQKKNDQLRPDRQQRLEAAGFTWGNHRDLNWDRNFDRLVEFHRTHGHFWVPARIGRSSAFHLWVNTQRMLKQFGRLHADRQQRLEAIGFAWDRPLMQDRWEQRFAEMMEYRRTQGHFQIASQDRKHGGLRAWIRDQRDSQSVGRLRPDLQRRLEAVGFPWEASLTAAEQEWEQRFSELAVFYERFGHSDVPDEWPENRMLARWVHTQRQRHSNQTLQLKRIYRLEGMHFNWSLSGRRRSFHHSSAAGKLTPP